MFDKLFKKDVEIVDVVEKDTHAKIAKFLKKKKLKRFLFFSSLFAIDVIFFYNNILLLILFGVIIFFINRFSDHSAIDDANNNIISIWFGVPGAGKTTMASYLTRSARQHGRRVLSNVEIDGTYKLNVSDLGKFDMSFNGEGCQVIIDEASLEFDNRNFKDFAKTTGPLYFALHRHMQNKVDVFSQGVDVDKRIRDRASAMYALKKFPIPGFLMYRAIKKILVIKEDDKQLVDGFEYKGLPRIIFCKPLWASFDTLDLDLCPKEQKEWIKWNNVAEEQKAAESAPEPPQQPQSKPAIKKATGDFTPPPRFQGLEKHFGKNVNM